MVWQCSWSDDVVLLLLLVLLSVLLFAGNVDEHDDSWSYEAIIHQTNANRIQLATSVPALVSFNNKEVQISFSQTTRGLQWE